MMLTVFRSRMKADLTSEQIKEVLKTDARMGVLARATPGYIAHKGFMADDGERVVVIEFETEQAQLVFVHHPEHLEAMQMGRKVFHKYSIQVCNVQRKMHSNQ
jgi:heme-degrading monooxygenase HmoA